MSDLLRKRLIAETEMVPAVPVESIRKYRFLRKSGDNIQIAIPVAALILTAFTFDISTSALFYSLVVCFLVTHLLKYLLNCRRPNGGKHSFPSGHTSIAFAGAAFIHFNFASDLAILFYLCAGFVALTRVIARKHYPRDVFAGALIGTGSALIFSY